MDSTSEWAAGLEGPPAKELLEGRLWVDGCFDFFHHGTSDIEKAILVVLKPCMSKF
jgi:hypothetical protein